MTIKRPPYTAVDISTTYIIDDNNWSDQSFTSGAAFNIRTGFYCTLSSRFLEMAHTFALFFYFKDYFIFKGINTEGGGVGAWD